jgi:hypothetical protein
VTVLFLGACRLCYNFRERKKAEHFPRHQLYHIPHLLRSTSPRIATELFYLFTPHQNFRKVCTLQPVAQHHTRASTIYQSCLCILSRTFLYDLETASFHERQQLICIHLSLRYILALYRIHTTNCILESICPPRRIGRTRSPSLWL